MPRVILTEKDVNQQHADAALNHITPPLRVELVDEEHQALEHQALMARYLASGASLDSEGVAFALRSRAQEAKPDTYADRLLKYVPTEIITLYITLEAILKPFSSGHVALYWFIFLFGVVTTPLFLYRKQNVRKKLQLAISTVSFAVWVFALGGPFAASGSGSWYEPLYGAILLPMYTFLVPVIEP